MATSSRLAITSSPSVPPALSMPPILSSTTTAVPVFPLHNFILFFFLMIAVLSFPFRLHRYYVLHADRQYRLSKCHVTMLVFLALFFILTFFFPAKSIVAGLGVALSDSLTQLFVGCPNATVDDAPSRGLVYSSQPTLYGASLQCANLGNSEKKEKDSIKMFYFCASSLSNPRAYVRSVCTEPAHLPRQRDRHQRPHL